ncbi:MAG: apolipoprotein N-acyltransferase [Bacteroidetes bacterium]|nr:apolipoprotein N-acyltransferase [Bacteroidota bacterium]
MKKYQLLLLSLLSGLLLALAWPLNGISYLIFFAFIPMLWVEEIIIQNPLKYGKFSFFFIVFIGFFVWNVLTTYWIWNSTEAGAVFAFLLNSLLMTMVFNFYHYSRRVVFRKNKAYFALVLYWIAFEYFHMDWDFSWPWLTLGNVFANNPKLIQWYEYTGAFGGTLWIFLINIFFFEIFLSIKNKESFSFNLKNKFFKTSIICVLVLVIPIVFSVITYNRYEEKGTEVEVVVVQPNVDPYTEQYITPPLEILQQMLVLAETKTDSNVDFVLFPESALQENVWEEKFDFSQSVNVLRCFTKKFPKLAVISGISTQRLLKEDEPITPAAREFSDDKGRYYEHLNTALLVDHSGNIQRYHKSKLTPGVEKMPFKKIFKPIEKLAIDLGGTVGSLGVDIERKVFNCQNGVKLSPVICYESIYGGFVSEFVKNGAELIFIITNDGWWGNTAGHRQHFSYAALRAIESRRDIARSANTGISCFVNQRGDILNRTDYWEPAAIRQKLHTNSKLTFYVKYGDYIGKIALYSGFILLLLSFIMGIKLINRNKMD